MENFIRHSVKNCRHFGYIFTLYSDKELRKILSNVFSEFARAESPTESVFTWQLYVLIAVNLYFGNQFDEKAISIFTGWEVELVRAATERVIRDVTELA